MNTSVLTSIAEVCRRLHHRNLLAAADGNVSYRVSDQEIWITPSGINKGFLNPAEMSLITLDNQVLRGNPSGERLMHLEVYRKCPEAKAVVHAHPPTAIALSLAFPNWEEVPADSLSELILAVGQIPILPYARPGTQEMGDRLRPHLQESRVMILARHGALSWGESIDEAYNGMERIEHISQILKSSIELKSAATKGHDLLPSSLPENEVKYLRELRKKLGARTL